MDKIVHLDKVEYLGKDRVKIDIYLDWLDSKETRTYDIF